MNKYKRIIFGLIIGVIFIGGIIPFGTQFWLPFFNPNAFTGGVEVWNQYVSIVLGIVATILSIISLKMCFDSEKSSRTTELRTQRTLDKIDARIELINQKQDQLFNTVSKNSQNVKGDNVEKNIEWKQPSDNKINEEI